MRTIGLLGGMSWESSAEYYRIINQEVRRRLGGAHSAEIVMWSFDFARIEALQEAGAWEEAGDVLATTAAHLEAAGAELVVICTNTMHRLAGAIEARTSIPLIHIADATAAAVEADGIHRVGLLGTRYTMEQEFYRGQLETAHALEVIVPDEPDRSTVHDIIYEELVQGIVSDESRRRYLEVIGRLVGRGAEGIILGCTEIELLVGPEHANVPVYPTTRIHAIAAVDRALDDRA